jgi:predicted Fe-S protein YdhL (DUF1289 family)
MVAEQCTGCNRTLFEIAMWSRLTDQEKLAILKTIENTERISDGQDYRPNTTRRRSSGANPTDAS